MRTKIALNFARAEMAGTLEDPCIFVGHGLYVAELAQPASSSDSVINNSRVRPQEQLEFLRNTYKVLMTRGMRGCYVYFQDEETGRFFQSRTE